MKCPRLPKRIIKLVIALAFLAVLLWQYGHQQTVTPTGLLTPIQHVDQVETLNHTYISPLSPLSFDWPRFSTWRKDSWVFPEQQRLQRPPLPSFSPFADHLRHYINKGHTYIELNQLGRKQQIARTLDLTVAIYIDDDLSVLDSYLDALSRQTVQPSLLWILHANSDLKEATIAKRFAGTTMSASIINITGYTGHTDRKHQWIQALQHVSTQWIWLLDAKDSSLHIKSMADNELEYLYRTSQLSDYQQTLLGIDATLLPANVNKDPSQSQFMCLPTKELPAVSQPADLLHGAWLLKTAWIASLASDFHPLGSSTPRTSLLLSTPFSYYLSQSLRAHAHVLTVALPSPYSRPASISMCSSLHHTYVNNKAWVQLRALHMTPTVLDYRQITILRHQYQQQHSAPWEGRSVYIVHGSHQASSLYPLLCQPQQYPVHIVVTGKRHGMSGLNFRKAMQQMDNCVGENWAMIHDLDIPDHLNSNDMALVSSILKDIFVLTDVLRPDVLVHMFPASSPVSQGLSSACKSQRENGWILIGLPPQQIQHALWLADLPLSALKRWNSISIQLVMITDRRPHSLSRLLQTCRNAYFLGDRVDLTIHMEQSADRVTRHLVNTFNWQYGAKTVRHRIQKGGLMPAIVESWYPRHNDDYAVLLEDDISVSPLFYTWAKYNILKYRYGSGHTDITRRIFGISLYSPRNVELHLVGRRPFDPNQVLLGTTYPRRTPYTSQVPCSWGAVYFPEHWREFHSFLAAQLEDLSNQQYLNISLPMSRSDRWKKSWKKYFIQLIYLRGYVMIYPNFQDFESFATNHLEMGTHVQSEKRVNIISTFLVPLMRRDTILTQLPHQRLPPFENLPVLDLWGQLVNHDILNERGREWHTRVSACKRQADTFTPDDLLCPFTHNPAWERPDVPSTTKKIKTMTMTEVVEPLSYVTATEPKPKHGKDEYDYNDSEDNWSVAIDVALFQPIIEEIVVEMDDQKKDLLLDWTTIQSLASAHTNVEI